MIKAVKLEGSSMLPLFRPGQAALVETAAFPQTIQLSPGDCAVYSYEGRTLLHRVVSVRRDGVVMSDDAGRLTPHFVPWENISGRVISRNPLKKGMAGLVYSLLKTILSNR